MGLEHYRRHLNKHKRQPCPMVCTSEAKSESRNIPGEVDWRSLGSQAHRILPFALFFETRTGSDPGKD